MCHIENRWFSGAINAGNSVKSNNAVVTVDSAIVNDDGGNVVDDNANVGHDGGNVADTGAIISLE